MAERKVKKIDLSGTGKRITNVVEVLEASGLNFIVAQDEMMGAKLLQITE